MTSARVTRRILRASAGSALAIGLGCGVAAAAFAPWPAVVHPVAAVDVTPGLGIETLACAGPLLAVGRDAQDASGLSVASPVEVVVTGASETLELAPSAPEAAGATEVTGGVGQIAAAQSSSVVADDLVGFSASTCVEPAFEAWLAAGATTTGSADLLILGNPGDVPARVVVTVYGQDGPLPSLPGSDVVISPGEQSVLPLAGFGTGEGSPVVHIAASGAPVAAALQTSRVQTLEPVGVDVSSGAAAIDADQVIPGVRVPADLAEGEPTATVRMLAPTESTVATLTATRVGETVPVASTEVPLEAGRPVAVPLDDLVPDVYVVRVSTPEVAIAASVYTASGPPRDLAWFVAAPVIDGVSHVAVPPGPQPQLIVANPGDTDAEVTLDADSADARAQIVPAGASVALPVATGAITIETSAPVHAGITYAGEGVLGGFVLQPGAAAQPPITVYP